MAARQSVNGQRTQQNFKGTMSTTNSAKEFEAALALKSLDNDQKALVRAINKIVKGYALDLYGDESEAKYRYIVDLIIKRVQETLASVGLEDENSIDEIVKESLEDAMKDIDKKSEGLTKDDKKEIQKLLKSCREKLGKDISKALTTKLASIQKNFTILKQLISKIYGE